MAILPRSSLACVFLLLCLARPAAGFIANANAGLELRRAGNSCCGTPADVSRTAADRPIGRSSSSGSRSTRPRPAAGVGGLHAAFEVELGRELEMGSVLVAGADNYGHMTFKV